MIDLDNFSTGDMLALAKLSSAVYLASQRDAVAALGMTLVAQIGDEHCQVTVATWGGYAVLGLQGTRVSSNFSIPELFDDVDLDVTKVPGFGRVAEGFFRPLAKVWPQIKAAMPPGQPLWTGHSLGGVRAHYGPFFIPGSEVVSFGAPRGGDDAFWTALYPDYPPLRVVNEADFAPGYSWDGPFGQPADMAWLHNSSLSSVRVRPGMNVSLSDHSIDHGYIPAIASVLARDQLKGKLNAI